MDSDRFSLGIRDCVFLLFHLQGTRDVFACRSVPSVWMKACDFNEEGMWGKYVCECRVFSWFSWFSCQWDIFQTVSFLSLPWLGFTTLVPKGLTPLSNLFPPFHFFPNCHSDMGYWSSQKLMGIYCSRNCLKQRETFCICILLIELYLYNWHNCVFVSRIGSLITS